MKIDKNVYLFYFCLFLIITLSKCFEDKKSLIERYNLSKQISKYSNNKIKISASQTQGISCFANDFIKHQQILISIPKNLTLCPYYLFPFKYELISYILETPGIKDMLKSKRKLSFYLLSYYLLFQLFAPKEKIKKYIIEKNMTQYYNCEEIDDILKDYFPKDISGYLNLSDEHFKLINSLGYEFPVNDEMEIVFKYVYSKFYNSDNNSVVIPWVGNINHFRWAYSIILTRSIHIELNMYLILNDIDFTKNVHASIKKNYNVNNKFFSRGSICLIAFIDLINHNQPQETNTGLITRDILINTEKGYFINGASSDYNPGEEIQFTYIEEVNNLKLFRNYGFVLPNNNFNIIVVSINDNNMFSMSQINLCREINCYDLKIQNPENISTTKIYEARLSRLEDKILNYARVKYLDPAFDINSVVKKLNINGKISTENEIKSLEFYFILFNSIMGDVNAKLENSIKKCQKYRVMLRNIENYWLYLQNEDSKIIEHNRIKGFANIYLLDVSYKKIIIKHRLGSIDRLILNIKSDLDNIKSKFI